MLRRSPLRRTRMKRKPPKPRRGADPEYLAWVRGLPCSAGHCRPPNHPHHSTGAGMGLKSADREAMPMCPKHHREFHDNNGYFEGWRREERRLWQELQVERCQTLWASATR